MTVRRKDWQQLSQLCVILGFLSILGSIFMWAVTKDSSSAESLAHAERWGIFVGLWVPSFFSLAVIFDRYAERAKE